MTTPPSFPNLAGQGWSVHKRPSFSTSVASHVSGREVRRANYAYTLYEFELSFEGLDSGGGFPAIGSQSLQALMGCYLAAQGQFGTFLYSDPTDNAAAGQGLGAGDGATTQFAILRSLGGYAEPVSWVVDVSAIYFNGVSVPGAAFGTPPAPTLSGISGGTFGNVTYYVKVTWVTAAGEMPASREASIALMPGQLLQVASPPFSTPPLSTGYNVYAATVSGQEVLQNGNAPIAIGTPWTMPSTGLMTGTATPPTTNQYAWSVSAQTGPGMISFATAPPAGTAITADFTFAYICRFLDDQADFENFMKGLWQVSSLKFRSVKP